VTRKNQKLRHASTSAGEVDKVKASGKRISIPSLKLVVLKPVGYPLRSISDDRPTAITTDNLRLFEAYAKEQWSGFYVKEGDFLFDQFMYPDFAFEVVKVSPRSGGRISSKTKIQLEVSNVSPIVREIPKVKFSDVIGHEKAKSKCKIIQKYLKHPEKFGEWAPKNILFYGPPGTGKTMMAKALASETNVPIFLTRATDLIGLHVGDGARRIHQLFGEARESAPCIIFIDELDAIGLDRRYQSIRGDVSEVVNALLSEMDGLHPNLGIVTIGATNAPELLDSAIRNRFEEEIEFPLPTKEERFQILTLYAERLPIPVKANLWKLAEETEGFSGRDLKEKVLKNALHMAILKNRKVIDEKILKEALDFAKKQLKKNGWSGMFL